MLNLIMLENNEWHTTSYPFYLSHLPLVLEKVKTILINKHNWKQFNLIAIQTNYIQCIKRNPNMIKLVFIRD